MNNYENEDARAKNERSLMAISRAIGFSQGQFSLILVRCNYASVREIMAEKLRQKSPVEIKELVLPESVQTLFRTIRAKVEQDPPNALMVFGLESVGNLEELLASTNQVRENYRKSFPFPLLLWIGDEVLRTLIRLAPDFESWATSSEFVLSSDELMTLLEHSIERVFEVVLAAGSAAGSGQFAANSTILGDRYRLEFDAALRDLQRRGVELDRALQASVEFILGRDLYIEEQIDEALAKYRQSLAYWQEEQNQTISPISESARESNYTLPITAGSETLFWQMSESESDGDGSLSPSAPPAKTPEQKALSNQKLVRQGVLLFHVGLCYCRKAELHQAERQEHLQQARDYLQQCVEVLEQSGHPELVAQFLGQLGEILELLEDWDALSDLATKSLKLDKNHGSQHHLAQDYGFLAEVELQQSQWEKALQFANQALVAESKAAEPSPQYRARYLLLLSRAQAGLGQRELAIANLESARSQSNPEYDPQLDLRILKTLRKFHFQQGHYRDAFAIKQEQRAIEAIFGLRAFIGAGRLQSQRHPIKAMEWAPHQETVALEIETSGRKRDVENLILRLGRNDYRLTVIHGQSGVGKSSLLYAGLIPALKQKAISARNTMPVAMQVYVDWPATLEKILNEALTETVPVPPPATKNLPRRFERIQDSSVALSPRQKTPRQKTPRQKTSRQKTMAGAWRGRSAGNGSGWRSGMPSRQPMKQMIFRDVAEERRSLPLELSRNRVRIEKILEQLRENGDRNLLTVLIFDQFEEFFLSNPASEAKKQFYQFLRDCMNIPFVKVILSLREDYLHYLLECERLEILAEFTRDLLNKEIRYFIGNFSTEDACSTIKSLAERSHLHLEERLIDTVVEDLASELGEVRPIELQLVGAQLQTQNIATLEQYNQFGSKEKLIENFLEEVIKDCGPENEEAARLLLFFLTDESGIRRLRTKDELVEDLDTEADKIDLILMILVHAGLVSMLPEVPENRYQLIHDYLVDFIRQQEQVKSQAELKALREENRELQKEARWQAKLAESRDKQKRIQYSRNKILQAFLSASFIGLTVVAGLLIGVGLLWQKAEMAAEDAERERQRAAIAEIDARNSASKALLLSENELEALVDSVKAAAKIPENSVPRQLESETAKRLYRALYAVTERNRLEAHSNSVLDVVFSPDGKLIASASADNTVILWNRDGSDRIRIKAHQNSVTAISFSPDGLSLATASTDKTVKLWNRDGSAIATLSGHQDLVTAVSFSPDGELIATASADMTVKLWQRDGTLLQTIPAHDHWVMDVGFSPDGQTLATVSRDATLKLWKRDGTLIKTISDLYNPILAVSFSPDGKLIATAGTDKTVKVWQTDGALLRTLSGHEDWVRDATFSPDSQTIASAGKDNTVLLWKLDGTQLAKLEGHQEEVFSVSFSPDGKTLASASKDNTVKIWVSYDRHFPSLEGQSLGLLDVSFSPDGQTIATASKDGSVGLFSAASRKPLHIIESHDQAVNSVSFSPDSKLVASASEDTTVKLWDLDGNLVRAIAGHTEPVNGVSFSPDGKLIATASEDKTAKLWRLDGSWVATLAGHGEAVNSVSFSANGKLIITASADNTARLWTRDSLSKGNPQPIKIFKQHKAPVWYASFSPDSRLIATASADNTVKIWLRNGKLLSSLEGHIGQVNWVEFSPDGQTIATASNDNTVKLWTRGGKLLTTLEGHKGKVFGLSFSPDGKTLVSASNDKTAMLWNLDLQDLLGRGCAWVADYLETNSRVKQSDRALCSGKF